MTRRLRIGNQTSVTAADRMAPFRFALEHRFDAFEWFADKKWDGPGGSPRGWDEPDLDAGTRAWIRDTGRAAGMRFTVHAPWQANPLRPQGVPLLLRSVGFAGDIGADLVNLHLYVEHGPDAYVRALEPVIRAAAAAGRKVSIENTPETTPDDFNRTFERLRAAGLDRGVGMCLDIGHANLCGATHNDYIRYIDMLAGVPVIHAHIHENWGDRDSHLTLFTGPSARDDSGVRALLDRLRSREYDGVLILEQWPNPPRMLADAAARLRGLWEAR
jgi:sugar phosphate isomerase/epimerase